MGEEWAAMRRRGVNVLNNRTKIVFSAVVGIVMIAAALLVPIGTHVIASPSQGAGNTAIVKQMQSSPLTAVTGPASISSGNAVLGQFSVLPEQSLFNPAAQISITVGLKAKSGLNSFVNSLNNPNSQSFRHYVTTQQLGSAFGISSAAYSTIASYFESYGLSVTPSNTMMSMQVSGSVAQVQQALHTTLGAFVTQYASNGIWHAGFGNASAQAGSVSTSPVYYANVADISLPSPIASYVSGIVGLSGAQAVPDIAAPYGVSPGGVYGNTNNLSALENFSTSGLVSSSSYTVQNIQSGNYAYIPAEFAQILLPGYTGGNYQILFPSTMHVLTGATNLWNGLNTISSEPDQGQGITVAVIEVGSIYPSILQSFSQMVWNDSNHITNNLTVIPVGNFQYNPEATGLIYGWMLETALDIEYIAAMAPMAHIDLIAVPNPNFSSFDMAYQYIAQYLTNGQTPASSITITSNSYGSGEVYTAFFGSPMYLTVEDTLLENLNAVGVTNFFASGDYSGAASSSAANSAGVPAISPGSTSVGGGQVTAYGVNGQEFPASNTYFSLGTLYEYVPYPPYVIVITIPGFITPAMGVANYTYWAYGEGIQGTFSGVVGGGFGQSIAEPQPWWQNALDTYTTGALIDPVVSNAAAFNMSVWIGFLGGWQFYYGGTSFATPITAGEWALIEQQANVAFGSPQMGDINPLLFAAHNAYQAGVSSFHSDPYITMTNQGSSFDASPVNNYNWYYYNLSITEPGDPLLPWWFNTIFNPAGSGWNYLQGLGMVNVLTMDNELIGQVPATQHSLMNEPFSVMQVTSGGLQPITTLTAGQTYMLQIVLANGQTGGVYNVMAYSNNPNDGTYGGGMMSTFQTGSSGQFNYTPMWNSMTPTEAGSSYGYILVTSAGSNDWSFQPFAVATPPLTCGNLTVGVVNAYGQLQTSTAEVTMFTTGQTGYYNVYGLGPAEVTLNGTPVANALVTETSVNVSQFAIEDPTMPMSSYAPGVVLGNFLSDQRGNTLFWTDAFLAENNGPLYTQVVTLQASYRGLTSNVVTVYIEPQTGTFHPAVTMNSAGTALVGNVAFNGMRNVNYINISIGSMPGQYVNESFPPAYYDSAAGIWLSGVNDGVVPINFTNLPSPGTPVQLSMVAQGANDLSIVEIFFGLNFGFSAVQNPIYYSDPITIANLGPSPTASLASPSASTVSGILPLDFAGTWGGGSFNGVLTVSSAAGTTTLATGLSTGTYALNTSAYMDGFYTVTYTATTSTGLKASSSLSFYFDNQQASLNSLVAQLQSSLSKAQATIATLQGELAADNATIATMQSQIATLNSQIGTLQSQLASARASYNSTAAQLASVQASLNSANSNIAAQKAQVASLQAQLKTDSTTIASQTSQVASLQAQVTQLQQQLNSRKGMVPAAWYDIFGGAGISLLVFIAVISLLVGLIAGGSVAVSKKKRNAEESTRVPEKARQ